MVFTPLLSFSLGTSLLNLTTCPVSLQFITLPNLKTKWATCLYTYLILKIGLSVYIYWTPVPIHSEPLPLHAAWRWSNVCGRFKRKERLRCSLTAWFPFLIGSWNPFFFFIITLLRLCELTLKWSYWIFTEIIVFHPSTNTDLILLCLRF